MNLQSRPAHLDLDGVFSHAGRDFGAESEVVLAVASRNRVIEAVRTMRAAPPTSVPAVGALVTSNPRPQLRARRCSELNGATRARKLDGQRRSTGGACRVEAGRHGAWCGGG